MNKLYLLPLLTLVSLKSITPSQSDTNHFGARGVFEFDLGDSEIPLTPKQEREQKLLEEQLQKKRHQSSDQKNSGYQQKTGKS